VTLKFETITTLRKSRVSNVLGKSVIAGFMGYMLFLGILFTTKLVAMIIQPEGTVVFEMADFVLPVIGFVLLFLIRFLENYKEGDDY